MDLAKNFRLIASRDKSAVFSDIENIFQLSFYKNDAQKSSLYDTFDWRLYKSNRLLLSSYDTSITLKSLSSGEVLNEEHIPVEPLPRFWWDFPDLELKLVLKNILDIRALIKIIDFEESFDIYNALNEDAKTVARIGFHKIISSDTLGTKRQVEFIDLIPLRGYDIELKVIYDRIMQLKIQPVRENAFLAFVRELGIEPGKYSSKIDVLLAPDEQCSRAMKRILKQMLDVIKQNEDGIKKDIDTEFLHDFRVAIRRTRSAISQIPNVFPQGKYTLFKDDFKYLGQLSNRLRDMDVYLLNKNYFLEILPEELRPGLLPLFKSLQKERQRQMKSFIKELNGDRYRKILTGWELLLNTEYDIDNTMTNAARPVLSVANEFIFQRYKKIIKSGKKIDDKIPDASLHSLRIQCKKLRYLLEFFASLFTQADIELFIKHLKKMQDGLGEFNDLFVQQEELKEYLKRITLNNKRKIKEAAALGGLISLLKNKQDDIRSRFKTVFEEFHNKENTALFHKLFD
jgi:CHAD domain-containing protein